MMTGFGIEMSSGFWMIVIWAIVTGISIWLLAALFPKANHPSKQGHLENDALTILQHRYASGELSKEEFETLRSYLYPTGAWSNTERL